MYRYCIYLHSIMYRCVPHRKTNPLEGQDDIPPPKDISSPEHEASVSTCMYIHVPTCTCTYIILGV